VVAHPAYASVFNEAVKNQGFMTELTAYAFDVLIELAVRPHRIPWVNSVMTGRCIPNLLKCSRRFFTSDGMTCYTSYLSRNVQSVQLPISSTQSSRVDELLPGVSHVTWSLQGVTYGSFCEHGIAEWRRRFLIVYCLQFLVAV
jgi:hypothetical protein